MIRSLIVTLTLIGSQVAPAGAQNAMPALRANVTVNSDTVRIGDLVEHAGAVANVPIFRAPDLGTRGTVTTASIVDAIRPHQLVGIDTRGLAEVIVTRATRTITAKEISGRVAHALAGQYGFEEAPTSWWSSIATPVRCSSSRPRPATSRCSRSVTTSAPPVST